MSAAIIQMMTRLLLSSVETEVSDKLRLKNTANASAIVKSSCADSSAGVVLDIPEARDGIEQLYKFLIFIQSVNSPYQDTSVDLRRQFRTSFSNGLGQALRESSAIRYAWVWVNIG
jgi:hypothetical protein